MGNLRLYHVPVNISIFNNYQEAGGWRSGVPIPVRARCFSLHQPISEAHPAPCSMGTAVLSEGVNRRPGREVNHPPPSSATFTPHICFYGINKGNLPLRLSTMHTQNTIVALQQKSLPTLGTIQRPVKWVGGVGRRRMTLNTRLHLVARWRMGGVILPRPLYAFSKCTATNLMLHLTLPATQIKYTIKRDGFGRYNFRQYARICRERLRITVKKMGNVRIT
jgi:hypothetical protein